MFYILNQLFERKATFGISNEVLFEFCVKYGQYWTYTYKYQICCINCSENPPYLMEICWGNLWNDTQYLPLIGSVLRRNNLELLILFSVCRKNERNQKIETKFFVIIIIYYYYYNL
jgi:hypothetical protein